MKKTQNNADTRAIRELIEILRNTEESLSNLSHEIGALRDKYELPILVKKIKSLLKKEKRKKLTAAWIQRRFRIGYSRATMLKDEIDDAPELNPALVSSFQKFYNVGYEEAVRLKSNFDKKHVI